jgi:8-oxo-dGTP diphosphatase
MVGDGDGWVRCAQGHRHWGRFGAAGLLLAGERGAVLQHRAPWTHEGGTWGMPGGARDSHEDAVATALREAHEEADVDPEIVVPLGWWLDDHGGWSYTTVLALVRGPLDPHAKNAESTEVRWWGVDEVATLALHHGFAAIWPRLRHPPPPVTVVVDAANVVGSRPDGWWRDRLGATRRLRDQLNRVARHGIPTHRLPVGVSGGELSGVYPRVTLVVEGEAKALADEAAHGTGRAWWDAPVTVEAAARDADTAIVDRAHVLHDAGIQTIVVTADRGLRQRLAHGVHVHGPAWLLGQVEPTAPR